jgi:hypothetical protein
MEAKLARIKELIDLKEKTDAELNVLLGITEKTKRSRRTKAEIEAAKKEEPGT